MMLVGVTGLARSGKDHASDYLAKEMQLYKYAFAEPLKTMLKSVFGDHFHEGDRSGICPETCKSFRVMMQTLGTEWGREMMNPQVWVNLVARRWREVSEGNTLVQNGTIASYMARGMILSDVRFDSEAEWIQLNGGVILEIVRPEQKTLGEKLKSVVGIAGHQSEKGISRHYITHTIVNDGTLFDFDMKLMGIVDELLGRF
ncbi:deoxynucleotide monophosphate kinase [Pseudomonas phage PMBT3]|uniref:Deoxynucleotide monophosphate kinase n=1 Tax=Pseudomonas phage PMBT3 TaxID=2059856 RepID=A0A2I6PHX2_9CAUD|nr:deoxynucleotide monophosphate kinase [Pseudomonas phage PMBT3]AUM59646.1 deoxynucleotide monophosphate kinase [Pseudomonas phage PMBT3]